jgi:HEAT repeat protein
LPAVLRRRFVLGLVIASLGSACGHADTPADKVDPVVALERFDAAPDAGSSSRARLDSAILSARDATRKAALARLTSEDPNVRIAAVYALSLTLRAEDAEALAPVLQSSDPGERVLAASGMLSVGDGRAVPPLIEALELEAALPFGAPATRVWEQARFALLSFTGQDLGLRDAATVDAAAATAPEWEAWWSDAEASFEVVRPPDRFGS